MNHWRKFQFFDDRIPEPGLPADLRRSISCTSSGRGVLILGTDEGLVHVTDRALNLKLSYLAHSGPVSCIHQLKQRNVVISVGEETYEQSSGIPVAQPSSSLKLWDLDTRDTHDSPTCFRTFDIFNSRFPPSKVTTMAVLEAPPFNLLIAIGLDSGSVDLLRADSKNISRIRLAPNLDNPSSSKSPTTGLGFRSDSQSSTQLFVVTAETVSVFYVSKFSSTTPPVCQLIAPLGAPPRCVTTANSGDLVVARKDAFYFYNDEGPGPCYALECEKTLVGWFREYLVCVHSDPRKPDRSLMALYDLKNKLLVHSSAVTGQVQHLICEAAAVILLLSDGAPLVLVEKDMQSKLQALFKKSLYGLALSLVQASKVDASVVTDVVRKYGDHLYEMRDYDGAVAQYVHTIGHLEPSYVIQKFLSVQKIQNLTTYLEFLHEAKAAGPDHTTLLLNCYSRLKDVVKLDAFIHKDLFSLLRREEMNIKSGHSQRISSNSMSSSGSSVGTPGGSQRHTSRLGTAGSAAAEEAKGQTDAIRRFDTDSTVSSGREGVGGRGGLEFDAGAVIRICETAGFHEQALYVAQQAELHADVLRIMFESLGSFQEGLQYLEQLQEDLKMGFLKQYGSRLVAHCPDEVSRIVLDMCVVGRKQDRLKTESQSLPAGASTLSAGGQGGEGQLKAEGGAATNREEAQLKVAGGAHTNREEASRAGVGQEEGGEGVAGVGIEQRQNLKDGKQKASGFQAGIPGYARKHDSGASSISPMGFAELYVDRPGALIPMLEKFLEEVQESSFHREVLNTLLELYLSYEVARSGNGYFEDSDNGDELGQLTKLINAQMEPAAWAASKIQVKEHKERVRLEAEGTAAATASGGKTGQQKTGTTADRTGPSTTGQKYPHPSPFNPKLFGLPGAVPNAPPPTSSFSSSSSSSSSGPQTLAYHLGGGAPEFEEGSRLWYLVKAGRLLRTGWPHQGGTPKYDADQAVLSCQTHGFREGLLFLYERMRLFKEVISSYMREGDVKGLIASCKRLGDPHRGGDPSLWSNVLQFFGEQDEPWEAEVREVLEIVERESLLPPLVVLQSLSRNKSISVGVVKGYIARQLQRDTAAIEEDRRAIKRYQEETAKHRAELNELETTARVFQVNSCTACSGTLDLPAVHFLCMHSFHLRCMGDNESECSVCAPTNRTVLEMRRSLEQSANDQDRFFQELHDAKDGFSVVAEYFGRNIMNPRAA